MQSSQTIQNLLVQDFYKSHKSWLHSWLSKKVGSSFDAADLTHDTFMRVLLKDDTEQIVEPRAYLTRIAHGLMVNFLRRRDLENAYIAALESLGESREKMFPCPESYLLNLEKLVAIDRMLDGLPVKVRTAFLMHKINGSSCAEIAEELGMSVISIKKYIARALIHCASER
ncbi:putative RNA polymerase sigma factor FecI [Methylophilaceae bacterium]|nr:putative RNA polymerase sigma factor FecI [Methylophilaceae bacterium]